MCDFSGDVFHPKIEPKFPEGSRFSVLFDETSTTITTYVKLYTFHLLTKKGPVTKDVDTTVDKATMDKNPTHKQCDAVFFHYCANVPDGPVMFQAPHGRSVVKFKEGTIWIDNQRHSRVVGINYEAGVMKQVVVH